MTVWIYLFQCPICVVHQSISWMNPTIYLTGIPLVIPFPDFHLFSNAGHSGFGTHLESLGLEVQDLWDSASQDLHINNLELRAVFLALQRFQNHIYDSCVMVASDNSSVVAYLKKQGRDPLFISVHASMGAPLLVSSSVFTLSVSGERMCTILVNRLED